MFFQVYRQLCVSILLALLFFGVSTPLLSNAAETDGSTEKLVAIFPKAKKFVQRNPLLTPDKIATIEKEFGTKLRYEDPDDLWIQLVMERDQHIGNETCLLKML